MSRILCTFPGRAGDLLWALPSVRAIAEAHGEPVDFATSGEFQGLIPLLRQQPYIDRAWSWEEWSLTPPTEWCPPLAIAERIKHDYQEVFHLGYRGWPDKALPYYTFDLARSLSTVPLALWLDRPWIQVDGPGVPCDIAAGFTEAHFELKYGLLTLLEGAHDAGEIPWILQFTPVLSRWETEFVPGTVSVQECGWLDAARAIRNSDLFLGDCSALHVLAVALGKPVVIMEPMEARWNPVFYPFGMDGRVKVVKGHDGNPTFDARAVRDALKEALR